MMPEYPDRDTFEGTILHSGIYKDAIDWKGKRGVVIGTANTAHDVVEDMLAAELSEVTMVQRSKTCMISDSDLWALKAEQSRHSPRRILQGTRRQYVKPLNMYESCSSSNTVFYNASLPTELADKLSLTQPYAVQDLMSQGGMHAMARKSPERFDALEKAGFKTERYGSITHHLYNRMGGHYSRFSRVAFGSSSRLCSDLRDITPPKISPFSLIKQGSLSPVHKT